ncbi:MAG TPA: stalk domain-containing protein, partial [Desulfobacteria bacterium]|nr:stalk domain-containing protein [Desulfobacteria bacterium]
MLKRFLVYLLVLLMLPWYVVPAYADGDPYEYCNRVVLNIGSKTAYVNGVPKLMTTAPYLESGRVIVPLRYVAEFMDATVTWDGFLKGRTDVEAGDGMIVEFLAGDKRCYYGDLNRRKDTHANAGWEMQVMDRAPVIKKDNLMYVPIRYVVEPLG